MPKENGTNPNSKVQKIQTAPVERKATPPSSQTLVALSRRRYRSCKRTAPEDRMHSLTATTLPRHKMHGAHPDPYPLTRDAFALVELLC